MKRKKVKERKEKDKIWEGGNEAGGFRWTRFWVMEVLTRSTSVPALGEGRSSIPPLDASFSVFSQAQRFTGHNLEQLLGLEFMVILGKCNHTNVEFHGPQQMCFFSFFFFLEELFKVDGFHFT